MNKLLEQKPTANDAINLATKLEQALAPDYHVGLTGSQLYGSRPGHEATCKDIDLIIYPDKVGYFDELKLLVKLIELGFVFKRFGLHEEYGVNPVSVGPSGSLMLTPKIENRMVWITDYHGTKVDIQLRR